MIMMEILSIKLLLPPASSPFSTLWLSGCLSSPCDGGECARQGHDARFLCLADGALALTLLGAGVADGDGQAAATTQYAHRCGACGRQYQWRESLLRHQRVECGKKASLQCPLCPTRTKHKHSMQRHLLTHQAAAPAAGPAFL